MSEAKIITRLLSDTPDDLRQAADLLRAGELVGIPTETVYGLAADALNGQAVARIFAAKGRPQDNPLIVHIAAVEDWAPLVQAVPDEARRLAAAYWPGPLTMILRRSGRVPAAVSAGLDTVAVRMPSHPVAHALIRASGCPLAAPSANRSGSPSPTDAARVMEDMDGRIAAVVDGGPCRVGVESTVVDLTGCAAGGRPRLLRPGGVTATQLEAVVGPVEIDPAVTGRLAEGVAAASPGMKYKHYAPAARVVIVRGTPEDYAAFVNGRAGQGVAALCFEEDRGALRVPCVSYGRRDDPASQAHSLFEALRRLDEQGIRTAYAACPSAEGMGLAVYNRLLRAAGFEVIDVNGQTTGS
ncbi:MAG: threonylcarbamoyl-AMP synthase [Clostridiales bacterium]|jgi:L-threonylcarbamoyladenylate synthase|nr:threonylcarbamoyl-AMP synthase [Clostridiales bacterium]